MKTRVFSFIILFLLAGLALQGQSISSVSPTTATQNQPLSLTINGSFTNFTGATQAILDNGATSVLSNSVNVISPTQMIADFIIPNCQMLGAYTVRTWDGATVGCGNCVNITGNCPATVVSVSPTTAQQGQTVTITINAPGASFTPGMNNFFLTGPSTLSATPTYVSPSVVTATFNIPACAAVGSYNLWGPNINTLTNCFTVTSLPVGNATITGTIYADLNYNCGIGALEPRLGGQIVTIAPGYAATTNSFGFFSATVPLGSYTVSYSAPPGYSQLCTPTTYGVNANSNCQVISSNNFPLANQPGNLPDPYVVGNANNARPGFNQVFWLNVINYSPDTAFFGSTLVVTLDPQVIYQNTQAGPAPLVAGNTLTYSIPPLLPAQVFQIVIVDSVPASTPVGNLVTHTAVLTYPGAELSTGNNSVSVTRTVTQAADPNDKRVWTMNNDVADPWIEDNDTTLRYMVRFQNVGNDTAFTIVCRDTLDPDLNWGSFVYELGSHQSVWHISGQGVLTVTFPNALLPDSATNEVGSHGFFQYKINRNLTLAQGAVISNRCGNYFDFAPVVMTNTTHTTLCNEVSAAFGSSVNLLSATFTNNSSANATAYTWDFGDGQSSTSASPTHVYATAGSYNVCLISTNSCGRSDTTCSMVNITCPPLNSNFNSSPADLSVTFTDASSGSPTALLWDFGDGNTSAAANPSHIYAAPGTYTVCLIATSACTADTFCQQITVTCPALMAGFNSSFNALTASFQSAVTGSPTSYLWNFGDGNSSTSANPTHIYTLPGTYTVCLITADGCSSDTSCQQITVSCTAPVASFNVTGDFSAMQFSDLSSNSPTQWLWDFGDGNTSTLQNPLHTYSAVGEYQVCLTATSVCGTTTTCETVSALTALNPGNEMENIRVAPNPARGHVSFYGLHPGVVYSCVVLDAAGRKVRTWTLREGASGDLSGMSAGTYRLRIEAAGGKSVVLPLVVE